MCSGRQGERLQAGGKCYHCSLLFDRAMGLMEKDLSNGEKGMVFRSSRGDGMRMRCSWTLLMRLISVAVRAGEWGGDWDGVVRFGLGI